MEAEIIALQLPLVVQHALLAMGSSIAVACVDGPSPAGKIAGVLIAAGTITILAANWDVVGPQWDKITRAFQKAFAAAAASIVQAFNDIKIKASKKSKEGDATSGKNNRGTPQKNPDPNVIAALIAKIADNLKQNGKCNQFARALVQKLEQSGISYEIIRIESRTDYIYSNKLRDAISTNGYHYGIRIGKMVYDNLTLIGMNCEEWLADLGANGEFANIVWKTTTKILNH